MGPLALAVLAHVGQLKAHPLLAWFPVDLTLFTAVIVVLLAAVSRFKLGPGTGAIAWPFLIAFTFLFGVFAASLDGYGLTKILTFYTFTLVVLFAPFHLLRTRQQHKWFLSTIVAITAFVVASVLLDPELVSESSNIVSLGGTNTIGTSRIAGAGFLVCVILAVTLRGVKRLALLTLGVAALLVMLQTGSRAPVVAVVVAVLAVLVFTPGFRRHRAKMLFVSVVAVGWATWWAQSQDQGGAGRITGYLLGDEDAGVRPQLWGVAYDKILATPLGIGWGNYPYLDGVSAWARAFGGAYPHNVLLEVFLEAGWIPGALLLVFTVTSLVRMARRASDPVLVAMFALLVFAVVNAMASGDINDNRLMWVMLSTAWVVGAPTRAGRDTVEVSAGSSPLIGASALRR